MRWQDAPTPSPNTGFGLHDSANVYFNPPDLEAHARALRALGATWYKILADNNPAKAERCRIYVEHGVMPVVRLYRHQPSPDFVANRDVVRAYRDVGVHYFEPLNEPNLKSEWNPARWPDSWVEWGRMVARQWIASAEQIVAVGAIPLTPALSPGGEVFHREAILSFLEGIDHHGGRALLEQGGVATHWRPLNNPIDTEPGIGDPPNFTLWRDFEWFIETFTEYLGHTPPFLETESGYSPNSSENADFPPMTRESWAEMNRELYGRLDPDHPRHTPGCVLGQMYWIEGTAGAGVWLDDAAFIDWLTAAPHADEPRWGQVLREIGFRWDRNRLKGEEGVPFPPVDGQVEEPVDLEDVDWTKVVSALERAIGALGDDRQTTVNWLRDSDSFLAALARRDDPM